MLSNHLRNSYNYYKELSSTIKVDSNLNSENNKDSKNQKKNQHHQNSKMLSAHEKVSVLDSIVNSPAIMNTLILKSKLDTL